MTSQSPMTINEPILVEYRDGVFIPKQDLNLKEGWSGAIYLTEQDDPRSTQRSSLYSLLDREKLQDDVYEMLSIHTSTALLFLPIIFIDASTWLKVIDTTNEQHKVLLEKILNFPNSVWVTGDYVTKEFSEQNRISFSSTKVNWLMWLLWSDKIAKPLSSKREEDVAWDIFMEIDDSRISFYQCLTAVLIHRYKPEHVIIADEYFETNLPHLLNKIEQKLSNTL